MRETLEFIASTNFEGADDRAIAIIAQFLVYRAKDALAQPEHHALQAQGKHPAPCARHCEAQAFQIVIRSLEAKLKENT